LQLSEQVGLHPAMHSLLPLWQNQEVAVLQGVGYPEPNLSHFRSIEIWETASASNQYLGEGWLTGCFAASPPHPVLLPMAWCCPARTWARWMVAPAPWC
jgi:uncharacterized protein (DUF1501 family)